MNITEALTWMLENPGEKLMTPNGLTTFTEKRGCIHIESSNSCTRIYPIDAFRQVYYTTVFYKCKKEEKVSEDMKKEIIRIRLAWNAFRES